jgi:signal transduction histidine kinase
VSGPSDSGADTGADVRGDRAGAAVSAAAPLVLGPGARDLEVRFAVLSFAPPETISFRHRLQGKDADWVEAGPSRIAHYAALGPGRYRLEVQARHRNGDWGPADASLRFQLQPPFYRSLWFALTLVASALLLLLLGHRLRLRNARAGLHAVMAERGRIARDLHDTLAQAFVATSVQLECVDHALEGQDRKGARKHLDTAMRVVRDSLEEARRSVWVLRPQALERGLPAALETLVRRASSERTQPASGGPPTRSVPPGAVVNLEVTGVPRALSPLTEANLLRIAQEAVANAYRHARASRISLRLAFEADSVILAVTDDGTGIIEPAEQGGVQQGIAGMKERATEMGATISIERASPGGTAIKVEVPARSGRWFSGRGAAGRDRGAR